MGEVYRARDQALLEVVHALKDREGIPITTQIEMAVRDWFQQRQRLRATGWQAVRDAEPI